MKIDNTIQNFMISVFNEQIGISPNNKDNGLEKVIELYKNNSFGMVQERSTQKIFKMGQKKFILMKKMMKWSFNIIAGFQLVRTIKFSLV